MKRTVQNNKRTDLEECRDKIVELLKEYNCSLYSADDYSHVYLEDKDTNETINIK